MRTTNLDQAPKGSGPQAPALEAASEATTGAPAANCPGNGGARHSAQYDAAALGAVGTGCRGIQGSGLVGGAGGEGRSTQAVLAGTIWSAGAEHMLREDGSQGTPPDVEH